MEIKFGRLIKLCGRFSNPLKMISVLREIFYFNFIDYSLQTCFISNKTFTTVSKYFKLNSLQSVILPFIFLYFTSSFGQVTQTFITNGNFTVPAGVTSITVEAWGAGGGGGSTTANNQAGSGGGGGAYARSVLSVTAGTNYSVVVGTGGAAATNGGNSTFNSNWVIAAGGQGGNTTTFIGGLGGSAANSIGTVKHAGGNGGNSLSTTYSGGGGGGAGSTGAGGNAMEIKGGLGTSSNGGNGGDGVNSNVNANNGNNYGGGGSGAYRVGGPNRNGGLGANGLVLISWIQGPTLIVNPTTINFGYVVNGGTSTVISYTLNGTNLTGAPGNIVINAPANFEVSLTAGSGFSSSVNVPYSGSTLASTTIYARFKPTASNTNYIGNITHTGGGATANVGVNGTSISSYCSSTGNMSFQTSITRVQFDAINNTTAKPTGYSDFTVQSANVNVGSSYNLSVNVNTDGNYTISTNAWIDWNQNGNFSDAGETYNLGTALNTPNGPTSLSPLNITIPAGATLGNTRMRVSTKYNAFPTSCETAFDGEVEDYTINVYPACTIPTITGTTPASRCGTGTVVLGATASAGIINWYAASTGGTSIGTGTSFTTPTITTTTTYWVEAIDGACTSATRTPITATIGVTNPIEVIATIGTTHNCYSTLKAAFDAINNGTHRGVIIINVVGNTTETVAAVLNASGSGSSNYVSILIKPSGGISRTITGSLSSPLIDLNGADNVIIDGLNTAGNSLTLANSSINAAASTIRFILDAKSNTIRNCTIEGSSTSATIGTLFFSTTTGTGNSNNTITENYIKPSGSNLPVNAIYSLGTATRENSNNTISNNKILDFFSPTISSNGIFVSTNNSNWTIGGNKFYQTVTRTSTAVTLTHRAIQITSGNGYTIHNNIIGFANENETGEMTYTGQTTLFRAIELTVGTVTASSVQGNTVSKINFSTLSTSSTLPGIFSGISVLGGNVNIGTVTGNTIGAINGNNAITITASSSTRIITGIYATSTGTLNIQNNNIGSINTTGANTIGYTFHGIYTAGTLGNYTISENIIGSLSTPNSISIGTIAVTTSGVSIFNGINNFATGNINITDNTIQNCTVYGTAASVLNGILNNAGSGTLNITNNTVSEINNTGTSTIRGISNIAGVATANINNNTVKSSILTGTGAFIGILNTFVIANTNINNNIINNITRTTTTGAVTGISSTGAVSSTLNINNNQLGNTEGGFVTFNATSTSSTITGISVSGATNTCNLFIQANDIRGITYSINGTGAHTYIINTAATLSQNISNNTFTDLNVNTTASVTFISNSVIIPANGSQIVSGNRIVNSFSKGGSTGTITLFTSTALTIATGINVTHNNNDFSNINLTGTSTMTGWVHTDAGVSLKTFSNNIFDNWTLGSGAVTQVMSINGGASGSSISNNTISNITTTGAITGLRSGVSGIYNINGNTISNFSSGGIVMGYTITTLANNINFNQNNINNLSTSAGGTNTITAISSAGATTLNIRLNTISNIFSTGVLTTTGSVRGIVNSAGTNVNINENTIFNIYGNSTTTGSITALLVSGGSSVNVNQNSVSGIYGDGITSGSINGISITRGTTISIFRNKIFNLSTPNSSFTGTVNGIIVSGAIANLNTTIHNNIIGDLRVTAGSGVDLIRGISLINTGLTSNLNVYYNTVYLNAVSSGSNFGTSGIYHLASTTATTATLDMRNNIIQNNSTPNGTGLSVAFRRSTLNLNNYSLNSNNNLYYAGIPSSKNLLYFDTSNAFQTINELKSGLANRDKKAVYDNLILKFLSTNGNDSNYLHLNPLIPNLAESGGSNILGISIDFDGDIRKDNSGYIGFGYFTDIGADEFEGIISSIDWDGEAGTTLWNDAINWRYDFVPGAIDNVNLTNSDIIDINTLSLVNNITIENPGLLLTVKNGQSLTVNGNLIMNSGTLNTEKEFPLVSGTISLNGGTVGYTATDNQTISNISYINLDISGGGTKFINGIDDSIAGTLVIRGNANVILNSNLTVEGTTSINNTSSLTVESSKTLTLNGSIANLVGIAGLVLKSDANGTASLLHNTNNIAVTVERFISRNAEDWHFLSSPVNNQPISGSWIPSGTYGNGTGFDLYVWNEPTFCWIYKSDITSTVNWNTVHPTSNFVTGRGYLYSFQATKPTKTFVGLLNNGPINYPITKSTTSDETLKELEGFNLVGNPYPSSVDWSATTGWLRANLTPSAGGYDMWVWNPETNNYGVYNSFTQIGTNEITRYLAPMQGFFVRASNSGNFGMDNSVRTHTGAGNWFRTSNTNNGLIRITVQSEAGKGSDEALLQFGFSNNQWGASKIFSHITTAPSLYLETAKEDYSVQYLTNTTDNKIVPVAFKAGADGNYTLKLDFDTSAFDFVMLEDRITKIKQLIKAHELYQFKATIKDTDKRFVLHFNETGIDIEAENPAKIYTHKNYLMIDLSLVNYQSEVFVYNISGTLILKKSLKGTSFYQLPINTTTQVLIVKLVNEQGQLNKKLFIKGD